MDTDYQDLATATEVLNKAYQLKQVDKKSYWPLKSDIDRWNVILTAEKWYWPLGLCDVIPHTSLVNGQNFVFWLFFTMVNRWHVKAKMLVCQGVGGIVADINKYFRHGNVNWLYIGVSVILSLPSIITTDIAM